MKLYLDDLRAPPPDFVLARSSEQAIQICKNQMPKFMSLDHDLGGIDTAMIFLKRLVDEAWDKTSDPPEYYVHSANPVGKLNIISFMESWKRSLLLD